MMPGEETLLKDVNLVSLAMTPDGQSLILDFLDMDEGNQAGLATCDGILVFKYQTTMCNLPLYVGEVRHQIVARQAIENVLVQHKYIYNFDGGEPAGAALSCLHILCVEGGEVDIVILCKAFAML